ALINAATCIALLGSYICLSIDKTPINRLDAWFFGFAPLIVCIVVTLIYFLSPSNERSLTTLENAIASTALIFSLLVWWIRPTLWKSQPGPTFLFGCVPLILLILALFAKEFNTSNYFLEKVSYFKNAETWDELNNKYVRYSMSTYDNKTGKLTPQSILHQRYLILGQAGRGGMSAVYQAVDTQSGNHHVAIKEMSQGNLSTNELAEATARFQQEADLLGSLH